MVRVLLALLALGFASCGLQPAFADGPTVPSGVTVTESSVGREPNGDCPYRCQPANYYDPQTRVVVLYPGQPERDRLHELCHAHQHETVLEVTSHEPTRDIREWYGTREGRLYSAAIAGLEPIPDWEMSQVNALEDFANACAYYYLGVPLDGARQTVLEVLLG